MEEPKKLESPFLSRKLSRKNHLIAAVRNADLPLLKRYLEEGADVNEAWLFEGDSIFTKTIESGNLEMIRLMLQNGADVNNSRGSEIVTPLISAVRHNLLPVVELLVQHDADVSRADSAGRTPLNEALNLNLSDIAEFLIERGADVHVADRTGKLPMSSAIRSNNLRIVKMLVHSGADLDKVDAEGNTALTLARRTNSSEVVEYLESRLFVGGRSDPLSSVTYDSLEEIHFETSSAEEAIESLSTILPTYDEVVRPKAEGVDRALLEPKHEVGKKQAMSDEGFASLINAIRCEETETVKELLKSRANPCKAVGGKTPLICAVEQNNLEIIELLLQHGAEHTIQTALLEAILLENLEIVRFFLRQGVLLDLRYKCGDTHLISSIKKKNLPIIEALVESGADVDLPDRSGDLPLAWSLATGRNDIVTYLIKNGAKLPTQIADKCLKKFIEDGSLEEFRILVGDLKISLKFAFECGYSPLTKAAHRGNSDMVQYILGGFDDVNSIDGNGKTALAVAAANQDLPLVKYLLECGAAINMAKNEIEELMNCNEDFYLFMERR